MENCNIKAQKNFLRAKIKQKENNLTEEYKQNSDKKIIKNIISTENFKNSSCIFTFVGTNHEIDTIPLITLSLSLKKRIVVPLCIKKGIMEACEINNIDDLQKGSYGIMEPKSHCPIISSAKIDLGIIPCISCDKSGSRLGHGGGYYDRFLENSDFFTILVCRELLTSEKIPKTDHDISAKCIITEKNILFI